MSTLPLLKLGWGKPAALGESVANWSREASEQHPSAAWMSFTAKGRSPGTKTAEHMPSFLAEHVS
jgi:hypothetical protein